MIDSTTIMDDKSFAVWQKSLSNKPSTAKSYKFGFINYCTFADLTPSELLKQAQDDYENRVPPWKLRHVNTFEGYIKALGGTQFSNMTKLTYLNAVRNFYQYNKVPLPKINNIGIAATPSEAYKDIPMLKLEDIRQAVQTSGTKKLIKALILTFLSSGQAQAEIQKLKGKHLKNIVNGTCIVNSTRGKTNARYLFFIGAEALDAIKEYKPQIGDEEYVFTKSDGKSKLDDSYTDIMFRRFAEQLGFEEGYFLPHRFRHYFKSTLTGLMESIYIEYLMGHRLPGVESSYFKGVDVQQKLLDAYLKNIHLLTVFTDKEVLQQQYDELKKKHDQHNVILEEQVKSMAEELKELRNLYLQKTIEEGNTLMKVKRDLKDYPSEPVEEGKEWQLVAKGERKRKVEKVE